MATAALLVALLLYSGARPIGSAPPLGPFLDPVSGVWAVTTVAEHPREAAAVVPGMTGTVRVIYDDRAVPHIFAESEEDAYRALGFVVARDRLFQLELQTRAAAGRLTELGGRRLLDLDRGQRSLGLPWSAERKISAMDSASAGARAIEAYAEGVNGWITQMRPRDLPLEYRLTNTKPARWEPIQSVHLFNRMGWTLAYRNSEFSFAEVQALVGKAAANALFPANSPIQEPIQPNGHAGPRFDFEPLPPPILPNEREKRLLGVARSLRARFRAGPARARSDDGLGSNNWAVAPSRTENGYALLAGDPHLELTLPSIWYEAHLVVPGKLDVYGVTIPGAPGIVIGFTRDVAWTFTNTESDVIDYYAEVVDHIGRPTVYRVDGVWRKLEQRIERYHGKRGELLAVDTLYFTHRGPMIRAGDEWVSVRWTVNDVSSETDAFTRIPLARGAAEWLGAMASYVAPAQNMLVADRAGNIAIRSTGRFPLRSARGAGMSIQDGTSSASDWRGAIPLERYPFASNPRQGYLASANQQPIDPAVDSTYYGSDWYAPWRAMRINALLRADSAVTPDVMRRYQTDPGSPRADFFVPIFLGAARAEARAGRGDDSLEIAVKLLAEWDRRYTRENARAVLFERAMDELNDRTWDELIPPARGVPAGDGERVDTPTAAVLAQLVQYPDSPWWDDRRTGSVIERRDAVIAASLRAALSRAREERGDPAKGEWRWDRSRHANIWHLLRLPSLSALEVPVQGGPSTLSPSSGDGIHGASWRMVVEMGPEVHAWGTYPGGQSGNPVSSRYQDRVAQWSTGELDSLRFPRNQGELKRERVLATLMLKGS